MRTPDSILYLSESDVQRTVTMAEAVELAASGIKAGGDGMVAGDRYYMNCDPDGFIKPFSGYLAGEQYAFVKTFSFFPGNPERFGQPTTWSMVLLFDAQTGLPACLMEGGWVTALKTGASTAVTLAHLARPEATLVTVFGAGMQGRMHLRALSYRFPLEQAYVLDILPEVAETYAAELQVELGFPVTAVPLADRQQAVRQSDIVITVTTGSQPLAELSWLVPGATVARMGSYQEIDLEVITGADKVIVDNWHYVHSRIPELKALAADARSLPPRSRDGAGLRYSPNLAPKAPSAQSQRTSRPMQDCRFFLIGSAPAGAFREVPSSAGPGPWRRCIRQGLLVRFLCLPRHCLQPSSIPSTHTNGRTHPQLPRQPMTFVMPQKLTNSTYQLVGFPVQ